MSQVHNVTHVPVHSPLSRLVYLAGRGAREFFSESQGRRCGQDTGPLGWVAEDAGTIGGCSRGRNSFPVQEWPLPACGSWTHVDLESAHGA